MQQIKRIAVIAPRRAGLPHRCELRIGSLDMAFPFRDLVEFSDGVQDALLATERLMPTNIVRPIDRRFMQLESLKVQDAGEFNRHTIPGREVLERRAEGEKLCGGAWYMELSLNGADTDCSFSTLAELLQIVQTVVKRELASGGVNVSHEPALLVAHG